jgi:hypothetical protein
MLDAGRVIQRGTPDEVFGPNEKARRPEDAKA